MKLLAMFPIILFCIVLAVSVLMILIIPGMFYLLWMLLASLYDTVKEARQTEKECIAYFGTMGLEVTFGGRLREIKSETKQVKS